MTSEGRGILSPVRLPVPPLQRVSARRFFEYNNIGRDVWAVWAGG